MSRDSPARPPKKHSKREIAKAFGVHPNTVFNWLNAGKLKGLTLKDILDFDRIRRQSGNKH